MAYELNGPENICISGNVITLHIILRNEVLGITACLKLQVPKIK